MKKWFFLCLFAFMMLACGSKGERPLVNGYKLPDLNLQDVNGQEVRLSDIKNKIILVEFWASWCKPCRDKHTELNQIYLQYKDKRFENADGFEIYYVDLDEKKNLWLEAIEKDGIGNWKYHVADFAGMKNSTIPKEFQFEQIPTSYLIDADGTIIGVNMKEHNLYYELFYRLAK